MLAVGYLPAICRLFADYFPAAAPAPAGAVPVPVGAVVGDMGVVPDGDVIVPCGLVTLPVPLMPDVLLCPIEPARFPVCGVVVDGVMLPGVVVVEGDMFPGVVVDGATAPGIVVEPEGFAVEPLPCVPVPRPCVAPGCDMLPVAVPPDRAAPPPVEPPAAV